MHYKNGRAAKNGDKVVLIPQSGPPVAGILYDAVEGNDYCNGRIAITSQSDPFPNLKEVLHVEDVAAAVIPDSTRPLFQNSDRTAIAPDPTVAAGSGASPIGT